MTSRPTLAACVILSVISVAYGQHASSQAPEQQPNEPSIPDDRGSFHLFLLAGQSNMAGRGKVEASDSEIDPRIFTLNKELEWVPAVDPIHFDKPRVVGVGLAKTFGKEYADAHPGVFVGLIPCAAGGSPIASWQPGGYHDQTKSHPYDAAITRTNAALKAGVLKGILWHQGESDSKKPLSDEYETKLHELIQRFRTELSADDVPFIAGQLGQFEKRPWSPERHQVNAAHELLPNKIAETGFVRSDGLSHRGDQVHFDSASYRELGRRYFDVFKSITRSRRE